MPGSIKGLNKVTVTLAGGRRATYYYHRATGTRLPGEYGSTEFVAALAAAQAKKPDRTGDTLSGLIRKFEGTAKWRRLAESTQKEYRRIFTFWDGKFGRAPLSGLETKLFRQKVLEWHDDFSEDKPREADNRVTILARVLAWGASDGPLKVNVLDSFERAYSSDRSDIIWLPEHIDAWMSVADEPMQLALILALHTGQRQGDIRTLAWSNYDGTSITLRQSKSKRAGKEGRIVRVPCTIALKTTLDALPRKGTQILTWGNGRPFDADRIKKRIAATKRAAGIGSELHFHDLRGTTVTMLFEAGCTVAETAAITGHTLRSAQSILDKYLARTSPLATSAIVKFENRMEQERAKRPAKG